MFGRNRDHAEAHNKADSLARHSWAGEYSSSGPSRVHVLHSIEEKRWHEGGHSCNLWYTAACMQCQGLAQGRAVDASGLLALKSACLPVLVVKPVYRGFRPLTGPKTSWTDLSILHGHENGSFRILPVIGARQWTLF